MNLNHAIGELQRSLDQHAHNAPLHDLMGDEARSKSASVMGENLI